MKVSIVIFSIAVLFAAQSFNSNNQADAGVINWWNKIAKRASLFFSAQWGENTSILQGFMESHNWADAIDMVNLKGNVADLFPKLQGMFKKNPGKISGLVKKMMKKRLASPLVQNMIQDAKKMKEMIAKLNPIDQFEIGMVYEWFEIYKEVMDIDSLNPVELIRSFPKTTTGLVVKLMKYGFNHHFPEMMLKIDKNVSDKIVPKVKTMFTKLGDKHKSLQPRITRATEVIKLFIDFQHARGAGPLSKPVTTVINVLDRIIP